MKPQTREALRILNERGELSHKDAERFGCRRLAARIGELRHEHGIPIGKRWETAPNGSRYAVYTLEQPELDLSA